MNWEQPISTKASLIIGAIMLLVGLVIPLVFNPIPPGAFWVVRVTVALAAGFMGAGLLGTIQIGNPVGDIIVKAGGPVALTVLFYLKSPADTIVRLLQ